MDEPKISKPTVEELKTILDNHRKWRETGFVEGARAYLSGADLRSAYLRSADLSGADLSGADLRSADLRSANLSGAYLSGADLSGAYLRSADLSGAYLRSAYLSGADLRSANLSGAYLSGAYLSGADLRSADLRSADLSGANLSGANLSGADLSGADLSGADLTVIREDFYAVLNAAPAEVSGLLLALREGRIDGSTYGDGGCACLVGTIGNVRGVKFDHIDGLSPDGNRPAERWFLAIRKGDTPANNQVSAIVEQWINEWKPPVAEPAVEARPAEPATPAVSE